ncbi:hypothetical protein [Hoeflea sp. BAL378]|uniref:hypothetical protein n=1 Tax=Hoeflea sp. BAL378 TaxID=1547437 RepID=UPI001378E1F7|nr:hypothetical protein [Hoeflea sp. BAL378]
MTRLAFLPPLGLSAVLPAKTLDLYRAKVRHGTEARWRGGGVDSADAMQRRPS